MGRFLLTFIAAAALVSAQDLSVQAAQAMREGRYAEAERFYRTLIKHDGKNARWYGNLGLALHSQSRWAEATEAIEHSLRLQPSPGLSLVLGIDYLKSNQPCKAIAPLSKTDRREALADANYGCKRYAEAAKLYAALGDTRSAARSWWQARDYVQAQPLYEGLARNTPVDAGFAWEYGDTLLRTSGAEAALPWLQKAAAIPEGRASLGKAYAELGRFDEAIPHLEASVATDPDLLLPLSRAYKSNGREVEAERALDAYRKRQSSQD